MLRDEYWNQSKVGRRGGGSILNKPSTCLLRMIVTIRNILKVSGAAEIPDANPSSNNCRFCDWKIGCPNAIETSNEVTTDASHFL